MMQMYNAEQLRMIHEDRIAPYIENNVESKPEKDKRKSVRRSFNLLNQAKKALQG
mgnify:CR=1 FL=1